MLRRRSFHKVDKLIALLWTVWVAFGPILLLLTLRRLHLEGSKGEAFVYWLRHKRVVHQAIHYGSLVRFRPDAWESFIVMVWTVVKVLVFPMAWSKPAEERAKSWHAAGDYGKVMFNAAVG